MQNSSGANDNRRRYPRIVIPQGLTDLKKLIGIEALIAGGEKTPLLDLSYAGAALQIKNNDSNYKTGDAIKIELIFDNKASRSVNAEIVRVTDNALGVRFVTMPAETRLELERYMNDKMLGLNIHQVRADLLNARDRRRNLSHWYHGPRDTNIFLWQKENEISKAVVEIDYQILHYENGEFFVSHTLSETEFFRDGYAAYFDYGNDRNVKYSAIDTIKRVISVISQMQNRTAELDYLLNLLIQRVSL